jgi:hypothetical protein
VQTPLKRCRYSEHAVQQGAAPDTVQRRRIVARYHLAAYGLPRSVLGGRWAAQVSTEPLARQKSRADRHAGESVKHPDWKQQARAIVDGRLPALASLSYEQASLLPEVGDEAEVLLGNRTASVATFRQTIGNQQVLVTVVVALHYLGGIYSRSISDGFVFEAGHAPRAATEDEIMMNGG